MPPPFRGTPPAARHRRHATGGTPPAADPLARCWRYPCLAGDAGFAEYRGHGGAAAACGFSIDDATLFTCGEQDCVVLQWRFLVDGPPTDEPSLPEPLPEDRASSDLKVRQRHLGFVFRLF